MIKITKSKWIKKKFISLKNVERDFSFESEEAFKKCLNKHGVLVFYGEVDEKTGKYKIDNNKKWFR